MQLPDQTNILTQHGQSNVFLAYNFAPFASERMDKKLEKIAQIYIKYFFISV
jgi:deferrochelatase/peroxidase EfeB